MKLIPKLAVWALTLTVFTASAVPHFIDPVTFSGPTLWKIRTADDGSTTVIDPTGQSIDLGMSYATAYTAWEVDLQNGVTSLFAAALGSNGLNALTEVGRASYTIAGQSEILVETQNFSVTGALLNGDTSVDPPGFSDYGNHSLFALSDDRYLGVTFSFYTSGPGTARLAFEGVVVTDPTNNTPEPATLALVGVALFAVSFASRLNRRA